MQRHIPPNIVDGFTLIELLVVISIIGLLLSIVLLSLHSALIKARDQKRVADLNTIKIALDLYFQDYGYYPEYNSSSTSELFVTSLTPQWQSVLGSDLSSYLPIMPTSIAGPGIPSNPWVTQAYYYGIYPINGPGRHQDYYCPPGIPDGSYYLDFKPGGYELYAILENPNDNPERGQSNEYMPFNEFGNYYYLIGGNAQAIPCGQPLPP